jgi:hypothetical protein
MPQGPDETDAQFMDRIMREIALYSMAMGIPPGYHYPPDPKYPVGFRASVLLWPDEDRNVWSAETAWSENQFSLQSWHSRYIDPRNHLFTHTNVARVLNEYNRHGRKKS